MKREIRNAIKQAIKESELNGYKWNITENGLEWSYGETFTFQTINEDNNEAILVVKARQSGETMAAVLVGMDFWCDAPDMVEAYRLATIKTIKKANYIY